MSGPEAETGVFQGINVVSIAVPDLDKGREFYRDILELGPPLFDLPDTGWIEFATGSPCGNLSLTRAETGWTPPSTPPSCSTRTIVTAPSRGFGSATSDATSHRSFRDT